MRKQYQRPRKQWIAFFSLDSNNPFQKVSVSSNLAENKTELTQPALKTKTEGEKPQMEPTKENTETVQVTEPVEEPELLKISDMITKAHYFVQIVTWTDDSNIPETIFLSGKKELETEVLKFNKETKRDEGYEQITEKGKYISFCLKGVILILALPLKQTEEIGPLIEYLSQKVSGDKLNKRWIEDSLKNSKKNFINEVKSKKEVPKLDEGMIETDNQKEEPKQEPKEETKEENKAQEFIFFEWVNKLRSNSDDIWPLFQKFEEFYWKLKEKGPWKELDNRKRGDQKNDDKDEKRFIQITGNNIEKKLEDILKNALKVKVKNDWETIDYTQYFKWYSFSDISKILESQTEIVELFFANNVVRSALLYNIKIESILMEISKDKKDHQYPYYSEEFNNFLDYFMRESKDCKVFVSLLKSGLEKEGKEKLKEEEKQKLINLILDVIEKFRQDMLIEKSEKGEFNFKELLTLFKNFSKNKPDLFEKIISKTFGPAQSDQKSKFYEHMFLENDKVLNTGYYEVMLADKNLSKGQKEYLISKLLNDLSICHNLQFIELLKKNFESGIHLEILHEQTNKKLKENLKFKFPSSTNEDHFLRFCLKNIMGGSYSTLVEHYLTCLRRSKQADLILKSQEQSLIREFYQCLTKVITEHLPQDKIKIDLLIDKSSSLENYQELIVKLYDEFKDQFQSKKQRVSEIRNELRRARTTLETYSVFLKDRKFTKDALDMIKTIEDNNIGMTLSELEKDKNYQNIKVLLSESWNQINPFLTLPATRKELDKLADNSPSIMDFTSSLITYIQKTKKKFESFANPSNYSYQDSLDYFKRANKKHEDGANFIRYHLLQMNISAETVKLILENSQYFAAFRKILKLTDSVVAIRDMEVIKRDSSDLVDMMRKIKSNYSQKEFNQIILADLIKFEGGFRITNKTLLQNLPDCLIQIAKSPNALAFIQKNDNELIRTMRDDCGSEDTDIVNKLEAINRYLKPITKTDEIIQIDKTLEHICNLKKDARLNITNWIDEVDRSTVHLAYVFLKAQKSSQFQKTQVLGIMTDSRLSIQFNHKTQIFETSALFGEEMLQKPVVAEEFSELFNLIKILVSDSSGLDDEETNKDHLKLLDFNKLGDLLHQLLAQVEWMRACGIIDTRFTDPVISKIEEVCGRNVVFVNKQNEMIINFQHDKNSLGMIMNLVTELSDVQKKVNASLTEDITKWSLFNYFSGRKLFYLTELLQGHLHRNSEDSNQIINTLTESNDLERIHIEKLSIGNSIEFQNDGIIGQIKSVHDFMQGFTDEVMNSFELNSSKKNEMLAETKGIKVCSTRIPFKSDHHSKQDSIDELPELNEFEVILKLLKDKSQPMVSLSQLFYCGSQLNIFDLIAFLQRALRDPLCRFYFILNADALSDDTFLEFANQAQAIMSHKAANKNLLVFLDDPHRRSKLESFPAFVDSTDSLISSLAKVSREDIIGSFKDAFTMSQLVTSPSAGMGKTTYIQTAAGNAQIVDFFISGDFNEAAVMSRMTGVIERCATLNDVAVCIKLDYVEAYHEHAKLVDFALFCLCFLRKVPTEKGCHVFDLKLKKIFIELSNTVVRDVLEKSTVIQMMSWPEWKSHRDCSLTHHLPIFSVDKVMFNESPGSDEQKAMKLLSAVGYEKFRREPLSKISDVNRSIFKELVEKCFLKEYCQKNPKFVTYAQFKFWIKMLALFWDEMGKVNSLLIENLITEQKLMRFELFQEIAMLAGNMCNFTVEQARFGQDETKKVEASLSKLEEHAKKIDQYKERFSKLKPWDCKKFIIPMLNPEKQKFMLAMHETGVTKKGSCINKFVTTTEPYKNSKGKNKHDNFVEMLAEYLGDNPQAVSQRAEDKYAITGDNFLKIFLMILKGKMKLPIILMGESGCGKTQLTKFVCETLLHQNFHYITLYSGLSEIDILNFVEKCVEAAKNTREDVWVFFDEFNTTSLQSLICEIMIDRKCSIGSESIRIIPQNIVFVAACNPYRLKIKHSNAGLVPNKKDSILSHRVYPIPERVMNFIWDFGQISDDDYKNYINRMVKNKKILSETKYQDMREVFSQTIRAVHLFVNGIEERSAVSLRDINRVLILYKWFREKLNIIKSSSDILKDADRRTLSDNQIEFKSIFLSIFMSYGLRLNGRTEDQNKFFDKIKEYLKKERNFEKFLNVDLSEILSDFVDRYCFTELRSIPGIIPDDIAPNKPLKENFLAMLIAFDTHIPLIICGAPGTSKTLCTQILTAAMNPEYRKKNHMPFFSHFKTISTFYYGGSETSTAEGIKKVFERAKKSLSSSTGDDKDTDTPTIIFDEIGLAELSKHNPLKILHPLLEEENSKISFIGMSNWTLDMSKMNRLLFVSRPELTIEDLKSIFKTIILKFSKQEEALQDLETCLYVLAETYISYINWQKDHCHHRHFHGSRDMYAVSKFVLHKFRGQNSLSHDTISTVIKQAIERNFNGEIYTFGESNISKKTVPGLAEENHDDLLSKVRPSDLNNLETIDAFLEGKDLPIHRKQLQITSAGVFKRFYLDQIKKSKLKQPIDRKKFLEDFKTIKLVEQNITERNCRFLMLRSEGDLVDTVILARLKKIYKNDPHYKNKIIDWRGVENQDNQIELLSTLKSYISLGYIVLMKNLDALYGSLYDLFNQKYMKLDDQEWCFLYYGESKQKVVVSPHFKCIVIQNTMSEASQDEIEKKQPAPFLNRFEKFNVGISSLLDSDHIKRLIALRHESLQIIQKNNTATICQSIDLITSICLELDELTTSTGTVDYDFIELKTIGEIKVPTEQIVSFLKLCTTDIFLNVLKPKQLLHLLASHKVNSLKALLQETQNEIHCLKCLFTFTYPEVFDSMRASEELQGYFTSYQFIDGEELFRMGIQKRLNTFRDMKGNLVVSIKQGHQTDIIPQLKAAVVDNKDIGRLLVIVHLNRDLGKMFVPTRIVQYTRELIFGMDGTI
jgi:hypothetical protein